MKKEALSWIGWMLVASMWAQSEAPAPYFLEVRATPGTQEGLVRHQLFVMIHEGDRVSSMFGTDVHPFRLHAPEGAFNSPYNGSWSATGMNPKFAELMPSMADDTYATIGLEMGAKLSEIEGAEDPTMVQDPSAPWDEFFMVDGETHMAIDTHTGGAWFVLRTATNGGYSPDGVLIAQITTSGSLSGQVNVQIFPADRSVAQVRYRFEFDGPGRHAGFQID